MLTKKLLQKSSQQPHSQWSKSGNNPSIHHRWMDTRCDKGDICKAEYLLFNYKSDEVLIPGTTWVTLKSICLVKEAIHKRLHIVWLHLHQIKKWLGKFKGTKKTHCCQGLQKSGEWLLMGTGFLFGVIIHSGIRLRCCFHNSVNMLKSTEPYTIRGILFMFFIWEAQWASQERELLSTIHSANTHKNQGPRPSWAGAEIGPGESRSQAGTQVPNSPAASQGQY